MTAVAENTSTDFTALESATNPKSTRSSGHSFRVLELDGVRGLAAFAVLLCHLPIGFWFGETGVDLFFVLSGYLITSIIRKSCYQKGFLRTFYWRRAIRIFPIYYLTIAVILILNGIRRHPGSIDGLWYYLAYLQNVHSYWGHATPPMPNLGHTWTLAIEEQFYLVWPALLMIVQPQRHKWLAVGFIVLPVVLRSIGFERVTLLGHTDGLAWGALLACLQESGFWHRKFIYAAAGVAGAAIYVGLWLYLSETTNVTGKRFLASNWPIAIISICYAGLIGWIVCQREAPAMWLLRTRPLVFLGQISYGLYLYHWVLYETLDTVVKFGMGYDDPWWLSVLKVLASFAVAVVSWRSIELPLMQFKDRFGYGSPPRLRAA